MRQQALEDSSLESARVELQKAAAEAEKAGRGAAGRLAQGQLQSWMHEWLTALQAHLEQDIAEMATRSQAFDKLESDGRGRKNNTKEAMLCMYLQALQPSQLALITILEVMRQVGASGITDGVKAVRAMSVIGKGVETEHQAQTLRDLSGSDSKLWQGVLDSQTQQPVSHLVRSAWAKIGRGVKEGSLSVGEVDWAQVWTPTWTQQIHLDIGSYLLVALLQTAKVKRTAVHPKTQQEV